MSDSFQPHGLYSPLNSPGQDIAVGSLSLLQGIFPTQESHRGLLHCRWILYQPSYQGSPLTRILVYYKGYRSLTTRQKRCMGQGTGKGHGASMCSEISNIYMFTSQEAL